MLCAKVRLEQDVGFRAEAYCYPPGISGGGEDDFLAWILT